MHDRPDAADVGKRDQQRGLAFHAAQMPHGVLDVLGPGGRAAMLGQQRGKMRLRLRRHDAQEALRIAGDQVPQMRRAFGQAFQQSLDGGVSRQQRLKLRRFGVRQVGKPIGDAGLQPPPRRSAPAR